MKPLIVKPIRRLLLPTLILALLGGAFTFTHTAYSGATTVIAQKSSPFAGAFEVHKFGAKGDGKALDSPAINKAIDAAAAAGGGTVLFTAGTYLSLSIRLKSNVALYIDQRRGRAQIVIPDIMMNHLVIPAQLTGGCVQRQYAVCI